MLGHIRDRVAKQRCYQLEVAKDVLEALELTSTKKLNKLLFAVQSKFSSAKSGAGRFSKGDDGEVW